ncbi:MAG TPA: YkgJ family cysteine cluster protein [Candidatus Angelobacter sp.]|jgi:Fe-S-cluster containining protein|nr:YkgJ family cysteine cluster protein [Candidatus Angelobacter sp.]
MKGIDNLYAIVEPLSSQPECLTCDLCERNVGLVYLINDESSRIKKDGHQVARTSEGVEYLSRSQSKKSATWCSCFDTAKNQCSIYPIRPLCCRLYPLDLMKIDGELWWIVHAECPIAERFDKERKLDALSSITIGLETVLSPEQLRGWRKIDDTSQTTEAFIGDQYRIHKLRRFGSSVIFP